MHKNFSLSYTGLTTILFLVLVFLLMLPAFSQMRDIFVTQGFEPHAHCFLWNPPILRMYVVSDSLIGVSYMAISLMLVVMYQRFHNIVPYPWLALAFAGFIFSCGITHFMDVWTLWNPTYRLSAYAKFITAVVSAGTAFMIPPLIPKYVNIINNARVSEQRRQQLNLTNTQLEARIKENQRTLEVLRLTEQRLRKVIDSAPVVLATFDEKGTITMVEGNALKRLNRTSDEFVGRTIHEVTKANSGARAAFNEALAGKESTFVSVTEKDFVFENRYSPLRDDESNVTGVIGVSLDITERLIAEVELRNAYEKEHELNSLRARFISRMSHEFRTPLAVISTSVQMLANYADRMTQEQRENRVETIHSQIYTMTSMLDDVLHIGQIAEQEMQFNPSPLDLNSFSKDLIGVFSASTSRVRLNYEGDLACSNTWMDRQLLTMILNNVIGNAIRYSADDGQVDVSLKCEGQLAIFTVSDHGRGIPEANHEHIFERFYRGDNIEGIPGTGLGLAIAKSAVDMHNGEIEFTSALGVGTTFTIKLPLS